jgi:hypothetical protein
MVLVNIKICTVHVSTSLPFQEKLLPFSGALVMWQLLSEKFSMPCHLILTKSCKLGSSSWQNRNLMLRVIKLCSRSYITYKLAKLRCKCRFQNRYAQKRLSPFLMVQLYTKYPKRRAHLHWVALNGVCFLHYNLIPLLEEVLQEDHPLGGCSNVNQTLEL